MRTINVYISTKLSGDLGTFAVLLKSEKDVFTRVYADAEGHPVNTLALHAVYFAMMSIKVPSQEISVVLNTNNRYVIGMLERDENGWLKAAAANVDVIALIRGMVPKFKSFSAEYDKSSEDMLAAVDLIKTD